MNLKQMHEATPQTSPQAGAARTAIFAYLGTTDSLARCDSLLHSYADQSFYPANIPFLDSTVVGSARGDYFQRGNCNYKPSWICGDTSSWTLTSPNCLKTELVDGDTATIDG